MLMSKLHRVLPGRDPGIRRVRSGAGFRYLRPTGAPVQARDRARIAALVIPPAWQDVWICTDANGHIQAVGTDEAGRRQYLYHPDWATKQDKGKFARSMALAAQLPTARAKVTSALHTEGIGRERVLAVAFRLLDRGAPRIGSTRALRGTRGLTTLRRGDASVDGTGVTLAFPGKGGKPQRLRIDDVDLASAVGELTRGAARRRLLAYRRGRRRVALTPVDVNDYIRHVTGDSFTAKDFRTLRGTIVAAQELAAGGPIVVEGARRRGRDRRRLQRERDGAERRAVRACAAALGNTEAVARGSYIDPRVFERFREGRALDLSVSPETAIRRLLLE